MTPTSRRSEVERCGACQDVTEAGKPTTCPECPSRASAPFRAPTCECNHPPGDHRQVRVPSAFTAPGGACFRCSCRAYSETEREAA